MRIKDVVEAQVYGLKQLDKATLKKLEPLLKKTINSLAKELSTKSKDEFDYIKKKQTLLTIESTLRQLKKILNNEMINAGDVYNRYGIIQTEKEIYALARFYPTLNRTKLSLDKNNFLINRMQASLDTYNSKTRATVIRALQQGILQNVSGHKVTTSLTKFMDNKTWQIQRIVRTEMHNIFNATKVMAYSEVKKEFLPDLKKALWHPIDHRTGEDSLKLSKLHPIVDIDKPFEFEWNGYKRVFMNPPDRPNDRAVLVPYRKNWQKQYKE